MAEPYMRVPIGKAFESSFKWAWAVTVRHAGLMIAMIALSVALALVPYIGAVLISIAIVPLILVSHNEVIRGSGGLNASTLGQNGGRAALYFLDAFLIGLATMAVLFLPSIVFLTFLAMKSMGRDAAIITIVAVFFLIGLPVAFYFTMRLSIRLPSRAIGETLTWTETWRLCRGHTIRLVVASLLVVTPLAGMTTILTAPFYELPVVVSLLSGAVAPIQAVLFACFLSLAYLHCKADFERRRQMPVPV